MKTGFSSHLPARSLPVVFFFLLLFTPGAGAQNTLTPEQQMERDKNSAAIRQKALKDYEDHQLLADMKKAEAGDVQAQLTVGQFYAQKSLRNDLPSANSKQEYRGLARMYLEQAARSSNPLEARSAQESLGNYYKTQEYDDSAVEHFKKAAEMGSNYAKVQLGDIYLSSDNKEIKDPRKAFQLFSEADAQHYDGARTRLADMYLKGEGVEQDTKKAITLLESGDQDARVRLADLYRWGGDADGKYIEPDPQKALACYTALLEDKQTVPDRGARQAAMSSLSEMYLEGRGVPVDTLAALKWHVLANKEYAQTAKEWQKTSFLEADELYAPREFYPKGGATGIWAQVIDGDQDATLELARRYQYGDGVEKNPQKAAELYNLLVEVDDLYVENTGAPSLQATQARDRLTQLEQTGYAPRSPGVSGGTVVGDTPKTFTTEEARAVAGSGSLAKAPGTPAISAAGAARTNTDPELQGDLLAAGHTMFEQKKYNEAREFYLQAAAMGVPGAMSSLGYMYNQGLGVATDNTEAARWYRQAAEEGHLNAMKNLAILYEKGWGVPKDMDESLRWYKKAAEAGNKEVMNTLGYMYEQGELIPKNMKEAARWYKMGAEANNTVAMRNLGRLYQSGDGVPKKSEEAIRLYRQAAEMGYARAAYSLGTVYYFGQDVKQDYAEAARWYRQAAEGEIDGAMTMLAKMYKNGEGVKKDLKEEEKWLLKAAEKGNATAMTYLGQMYMWGPLKNLIECLKWLSLAAEKGNGIALYELGTMYQWGRGVPKDQVKAAQLYTLSKEAGSSLGQKGLDNLAYWEDLGQGFKEALQAGLTAGINFTVSSILGTPTSAPGASGQSGGQFRIKWSNYTLGLLREADAAAGVSQRGQYFDQETFSSEQAAQSKLQEHLGFFISNWPMHFASGDSPDKVGTVEKIQ